MKCTKCDRELILGHHTLAHYYPEFYPNPPPIVKGDVIWVTFVGDKISTFCSKKHAPLNAVKVTTG